MELNLAAGARPGSLVACNPVERDRRWPRPHACWPAREGAVGMQLGRADEGSPARELAGVARRLQSGRAGWPGASATTQSFFF